MGAHDISLLVQEMRCEARVTGGVHVAVSSSHSTEPLHPLAVARTTGRELARSTTAWNDVLELMAPPESVLHVTVRSEAAGSQSVLVASRDVRLDELDFNAGFADQRISLLSDCGAKVWLRLAASRRRCDITLLRGGLRPTSPWVQLSPEPDDLAAPYSERRDGSDGTLQPANAPQRKGSTPSAKRVCESGIASICNAMHRFPFDVLLGRGRILVGARAPFNVTSVDYAAAAVLGTRAEAVGRSVAVLALEHSDRLRLLEACDHASGTGWREHRRAVLAVDKSLLFVVQNQATRAHPALEVLVFRPGPQHMAPILPVLGAEGLLMGCGKRLEEDREPEARDHVAPPDVALDIALDASDNLDDLEHSSHVYSLAFPCSQGVVLPDLRSSVHC